MNFKKKSKIIKLIDALLIFSLLGVITIIVISII